MTNTCPGMSQPAAVASAMDDPSATRTTWNETGMRHKTIGSANELCTYLRDDTSVSECIITKHRHSKASIEASRPGSGATDLIVSSRAMVAAIVGTSFSNTASCAKPGQALTSARLTPVPSSTPAAMQKKPTYARSVAQSESSVKCSANRLCM